MKDNFNENPMFANPICKETFNSLPKIYGSAKSNRSPSESKNSIVRAPKHECVLMPEEPKPVKIRPLLNNKQILVKSKQLSVPKKPMCTKSKCLCSKLHEEDFVTTRKHRSTSSPRKIKPRLVPIKVPTRPDDFESEHKVATRINTEPNLPNGILALNKYRNILGIRHKNRTSQENHHQMQRGESSQEIKKCSKSIANKLMIQRSFTEDIEADHVITDDQRQEADFSSSISKASVNKKHTACAEIQVDLDDQEAKKVKNQQTGIATQTMNSIFTSVRQKANQNRYKKFSGRQSRPKVNEQDDNIQQEEAQEVENEEPQSRLSKKVNGFESRQSSSALSISSTFIKRVMGNKTQFSKLAKKQNVQSLRVSTVKSVNEDGTFRIPKKQQYANYLKNYKVLDKKSFNLKQLIKKPLFTIVEEDEGIYFGEYKQEKKWGSGIRVTEKQIFEGYYEDDIKIKGSERNIDGVYRGYFVKGKREGYGTFQWNNGQKFEGNWKDGVKSGFGIWRSPKGDYYEGEWVNNRQQGEGVFKHKNSTYKGEFQNFLKHGRGEERFTNGDFYIGEYKNGKPDGSGRYHWVDGSVYEGEFRKGLRQGKGKWSYANGDIYEGGFRNDFSEGEGRLVLKTGEIFEGIFKEGNQYKGVFYKPNGEQQAVNNQ